RVSLPSNRRRLFRIQRHRRRLDVPPVHEGRRRRLGRTTHQPPPRRCHQRLLLVVHQSVPHRLHGHRRRGSRVHWIPGQAPSAARRRAPAHVHRFPGRPRSDLDGRPPVHLVLPAHPRPL